MVPLAKVDEKLPFRVIEFSKTAKRIILSHTKVSRGRNRRKRIRSKKIKASSDCSENDAENENEP
jgi:hypothetical protein